MDNNQSQTAPTKAWNWRTVTDNEPLYVYNKSGDGGEREAGKVVIPVNVDGDIRTVTVENTHIPQDLSAQALPTQITRTMEFRRLVNMGVIEPIEPDVAEPLMAHPSVKAEQKRLQDLGRQKRPGPSHVDAGSMMGGDRGGRTNVTGAIDAGAIVAARQAGEPVDQAGLAQVLHGASEAPRANEGSRHAPSGPQRPYVPSATQATAGVPTERSNVGLEVIDRLNKGEINMEQAVKGMEAAAVLMNEDEKFRLKQMQNLPVELREIVALM